MTIPLAKTVRIAMMSAAGDLGSITTRRTFMFDGETRHTPQIPLADAWVGLTVTSELRAEPGQAWLQDE